MAAIEPIKQALAIAGVPIYFENFDILCFPGFNISVLYKNEVSVYEVEKQNFTFQIETEKQREFNIKEGDCFYLTDTFYNYSFKLDESCKSDLTGWSKFRANYISRTVC